VSLTDKEQGRVQVYKHDSRLLDAGGRQSDAAARDAALVDYNAGAP